jgi:hypothetical protein
MCVNNPDRSPVAIHRCDTTPTPTGFAEIVSDDFRLIHAAHFHSIHLTPVIALALVSCAAPVSKHPAEVASATVPAQTSNTTDRNTFRNDQSSHTWYLKIRRARNGGRTAGRFSVT